MTFTQMLDETHIKYSEGEFRADLPAPYMVYVSDCETVCADGIVVYIQGEYALYLAVKREDTASETTVESVLDAHKIAYTKSRSWIGCKQMVYLCEYRFEARLEW